MREQGQATQPTEPATVAGGNPDAAAGNLVPAAGETVPVASDPVPVASDPAPSVPGPVARQLLAVAEARGLEPAEGRQLLELLAGLKLESPIPLEAMATVSSILLLLFQAEARFLAGGDRR